LTGDPDLSNNFATAHVEIRAAYLTAAYRPVPITPELTLTGAGNQLATLALTGGFVGLALIVRAVRPSLRLVSQGCYQEAPPS
jgi:uncharacterized membrane protein YjfL (UPF0719 family)